MQNAFYTSRVYYTTCTLYRDGIFTDNVVLIGYGFKNPRLPLTCLCAYTLYSRILTVFIVATILRNVRE